MIIDTDKYKVLYAEFTCCIETMQQCGFDVISVIECENEELHISYKIATSQNHALRNLSIATWDKMVYIHNGINTWSDSEIQTLNNEFLTMITGDNDTDLKM